MNTMDALKDLLIELDCTQDHVMELVNSYREVTNGHRSVPACVALAVFLKFLIANADGNDPEKALEIILELADAYECDLRQTD